MFSRRKLLIPLFGLIMLCAADASAASFGRTQYFNGTYLLGVSSVQEFDYYVGLYPGIADQIPPMTFYKNGTVTIGTESATYNRSGTTITINYVPPPGGYFTTVQYVLYRESGDYYWGKILFDGRLYGIMRGQLSN